ncbi:MAG: hypothetical protein JSU94_10910 [Phycisphaerales bacterium]|nr:MAG: hypothetical protein JSU94_10910 [Phycisphaerales bacterium]
MKTKSKKLTLAWIVPALALALLVVLSTALAGPARDPVVGSGSSSAINEYQFAGSATLVIRDVEKSTLDSPEGLLVTLLDPPRIRDDGVQHVVATHTFTFAVGSISTSDKEIAEPTDTPGLYTLNANMKIVSGTGVYEGVSGHLTAHGTIDFRPLPVPAAEFEIRGSISHR